MNQLYKRILTSTIVGITTLAQAQSEIRVFTPLATGIVSINNSGDALAASRVYNFASNSFTAKESSVSAFGVINNTGDVAASVFMQGSTTLKEPAVKLASKGSWDRIGWYLESDPSNSTFDVGAISSNGKYVAGNMSVASTKYGGFLYNTDSKTLTKIIPENYPLYKNIRIMSVNNQGITTGWADRIANNPNGVRTPIYINSADMTLHEIKINGTGNILNIGFSINNNNIIAGYKEGYAFTYNTNTNEEKMLPLPDAAYMSYFTDISDTGIAVGYALVGIPSIYEAIIYKPEWDKPKYLKDILAEKNLPFTTFDGKLGTAYTISDNGNYIGGFCNGYSATTYGWVVKVDDLFLATNNTVKQAAISIYPNPTSNYFNIEAGKSKISKVEIYALDGKLVKSFTTNQTQYNIHNLAIGNYIIKATIDGKIISQKLIKK